MPDQEYLALYRKYRPHNFDDVRGRDAIVRTLKNQIISGRIGHSYLFCGTRGTGKTTIARIFARAVNCENQQDGNPCGECPTCRAIEAEANLNVTELDAASNNSVDDIRAIVDQVEYSPTQGRFRVFIIDEVHMLSNAAFNALLKTLEEPPSYVIFILATTEPNKLPITILSRCQRYDFGRLGTEVIEGRLREVAQMESLEVEDRAFGYLASAADGSMRDGLSLLDQCNAFNYGGGALTYERTLEILGAVDTRVFGDLYRHIHNGRTAEALGILDEILLQGRELMQFVTDFTWYLRNLMLLKASEETAKSLDISADNLRRMIEEARMSDMEEIMRYIQVFSALPDLIRYSPNRRILTEMTIIRACHTAMDEGAQDGASAMPLENVKNRIRDIEMQLYNAEQTIDALTRGGAAAGGFGGTGAAASYAGGNGYGNRTPIGSPAAGGTLPGTAGPGGMPGAAAGTSAGASPAVAQELPPALPDEIREIVANWSKYASEAPRGTKRIALTNARLSLGDQGQLLIVFDKEYGNPYLYQRKDDDEVSRSRVDSDRRELQNYLQRQVGKAVEIEYRVLDRGGRITDNYVDLLSLVEPGAIQMPIETEDL
ncbi:MAG: DNA polymerase III subunit gamma/tau [Lachnospiraceae bacterium]|nr:DNA polymerase III subunit gamma/tau [Lachnospiraceae bacterium]